MTGYDYNHAVATVIKSLYRKQKQVGRHKVKELWNENWILNPMDGYEMFMNPDTVKEQHEVMLPYDALQLEKRDAGVVLGRNTGYYPYEKATYVKKFTAPAEWKEKLVSIEFEGVYRHAMVYVNDEFAGSCPHGYTDFSVELTPFLKYGEENEVKVLCKMHMDSRWYPGLGIYRNVYLHINDPIHIKNNGIKIRVEDITEGAVLIVETSVVNKTYQTAYTRVQCSVVDAEGEIVAASTVPLTVYGDREDRISQRMHIKDAKLWDTEYPYLYQIKVELKQTDTELRYSTILLTGALLLSAISKTEAPYRRMLRRAIRSMRYRRRLKVSMSSPIRQL